MEAKLYVVALGMLYNYRITHCIIVLKYNNRDDFVLRHLKTNFHDLCIQSKLVRATLRISKER